MKNYKLIRFYRQNKFVSRAKKANKRARKLGAKGRFSKRTIENLYVKQRGCCACGCGERLFDKFEIDHIAALSINKNNEPENLQLLKPICNRRKGTKTMQEFLNEQNV